MSGTHPLPLLNGSLMSLRFVEMHNKSVPIDEEQAATVQPVDRERSEHIASGHVTLRVALQRPVADLPGHFSCAFWKHFGTLVVSFSGH